MAYIVVPLLRKERRGIQNELGASMLKACADDSVLQGD